ncbi:amidase [Lutimaribacter sp. EGI FJ00015]|uniref:Amidase n=1 Tax=Lutimaribacter degradans TaxID=2945989 RepID=A0ACC5ZVH5_9RHOB|nr:amidase [Lutimaribacter sp. EGI FJ00013]MCM2561771.1 amidase [Lutimaribacter sp. EGI FJ00013]MCO0613197.1 amidase [Lutimaribacter sp. EGI FJ00015]MCO0635603.1 amidase [Lutimaribacter sp. EGI FJ00014]
MSDWLSMSAADLGRGIESGEIDPVELTETYLSAIDAHEYTPRIYARLTARRARAEARAARERAKLGLRISPLDGVPISWKDLFDTAGVATEAGSALLKDRVPTRDARLLRNATAQGLVCLGKTHMTELAFSGLGLNPVTATPPNVNDPALAPGGSSSGAATSVAFGLAVAGIGSDTGGSVRVPSAWNNLVGLKTTAGRLSLEGVVPLAETFDTIGPLCRTVEDAALLMAAMEGSRAPDLRDSSLQGMRIAALQTSVLEDVRDAPLAAFHDAADRLRKAGATIEPVEAPELAQAMELAPVLYTADAYGRWRDKIEAAPDLMHDQVRERFRGGANFSAPDYVAAWIALEQHRAAWAARMAGYDAVICPTTPNSPPDVARLESDSEYFVTENLLTLRNTRVGNLMGLCATTLPTGHAGCGLMLMAAPMQEERLLRLSAAAEQALG